MNCPAEFQNLNAYNKHLKNNKCKLKNVEKSASEPILQNNPILPNIPNEGQNIPNEGQFWECPNCKEKIIIQNEANYDDFKTLKDHCHVHVKTEEVSCFVLGCEKTYKV